MNEILKEELAKRGWSYSYLARVIGTTPGYVSNTINGQGYCGLATQVKIASALDMPVERLFPKRESLKDALWKLRKRKLRKPLIFSFQVSKKRNEEVYTMISSHKKALRTLKRTYPHLKWCKIDSEEIIERDNCYFVIYKLTKH